LETRLIWFSMVWGDWNDNVLLVGLNESESSLLDMTEHIALGPVTKAMGTLFKEYNLNKENLDNLKIEFNSFEGTYYLKEPERVKYQIFIHDDCFFDIKPVDRPLLKKLVDSILKVHSYYYGFEIDWKSVSDALVEVVEKSSVPILLKSDPTHNCLKVRKRDFGSSVKSLLNPQSSCFAKIDSRKAKLLF
jgi:hypothetical protein